MAVAPKGDEILDLSDIELVKLSKLGRKDAFRVLVERHQARILNLAFDILKSREDAEDVAQESFVKAFLSLQHFKGDSSFYTWIFRIAYNMAIDVRRRTARRGGQHVEFKENVGVQSGTTAAMETEVHESGLVPPSQENPHDALVRRQAAAVLQQGLAELSEDHRSVFLLRERDGLNYEEISETLGVPKGTVMSRLFYARKQLQERLREFAPGGFDGVNDRTAPLAEYRRDG